MDVADAFPWPLFWNREVWCGGVIKSIYLPLARALFYHYLRLYCLISSRVQIWGTWVSYKVELDFANTKLASQAYKLELEFMCLSSSLCVTLLIGSSSGISNFFETRAWDYMHAWWSADQVWSIKHTSRVKLELGTVAIWLRP